LVATGNLPKLSNSIGLTRSKAIVNICSIYFKESEQRGKQYTVLPTNQNVKVEAPINTANLPTTIRTYCSGLSRALQYTRVPDRN